LQPRGAPAGRSARGAIGAPAVEVPPQLPRPLSEAPRTGCSGRNRRRSARRSAGTDASRAKETAPGEARSDHQGCPDQGGLPWFSSALRRLEASPRRWRRPSSRPGTLEPFRRKVQRFAPFFRRACCIAQRGARLRRGSPPLLDGLACLRGVRGRPRGAKPALAEARWSPGARCGRAARTPSG
jgi:hypothetical protein